jgi:hypothetical protein
MNSQEFQAFNEKEMKSGNQEFRNDDSGVMSFHDWLCVSNEAELKKRILDEAHKSRHTIHSRETKMY